MRATRVMGEGYVSDIIRLDASGNKGLWVSCVQSWSFAHLTTGYCSIKMHCPICVCVCFIISTGL